MRVEAAMLSPGGTPPIEVYQIGDVYFVLDGNHRVSVARHLGAATIQAYVTRFHTDVPLSPDVQPDDLILKAEYAEFLERTALLDLRPDADLSTSVPGQHQVLEEHIDVHRYYMGIDEGRPIPYAEAVSHWYDAVYMPVVRAIREQDLLRDFPDRTEADLYLWLSIHRASLEDELEWEVAPAVAARDLASEAGRDRTRLLARLSQRVVEPVLGRVPGAWREEQLAMREISLFTDVLVSVTGRESGWVAMDRAIEVLRHETGRLLGIHVVSSEDDKESEAVRRLRAEFDGRCREAGVSGTLAVQAGEVAPTICRRARWTSLVVIGLAHPPGNRLADRLTSGLRWLIQNCTAPVLTVPEFSAPQCPPEFSSALLAYDGSPKADEALYLASYLANSWGVSLAVLTVREEGRRVPALAKARDYLERHSIGAKYLNKVGPVAETILETAAERAAALIMMGGYGFRPPIQLVLGSAVDQVLRESEMPVLICR
jgi:nucleotide-binding universal stress UspA family protein